MAKQTKISVNLEGLEDMVKQMGSDYIARVGVLAGSDSRSDDGTMGNADIGVVHEFGSESRNIPPRSFLRMPIERNGKDIVRRMGKGSIKDAFEKGDYKQVYALLGAVGVEYVDAAFRSGGFGQWPQLQEQTVARKGSSAILIDTGQLRQAVTSDVAKRTEI